MAAIAFVADQKIFAPPRDTASAVPWALCTEEAAQIQAGMYTYAFQNASSNVWYQGLLSNLQPC